MHLGSLGKALETIEPEEADVTMEDAEYEIIEEIPEEPPKESEKMPVVAPKQPEKQPSPATIPIVHESALAPVPQETLWPSKLGAQSARPYTLEVDMPIPLPWHQNMAYTVSTYIYLAFNFGLIAIVAWIFQLLIKDINSRIHLEAAEILSASNRCARDYLANECSSNLRRPALDDYCHELELCMDKDPSVSVFRVNAVAKALAEALNAFFDPLSAKAVVLLSGLTVGIIYFANFAFGFIRARSLEEQRGSVRLKTE